MRSYPQRYLEDLPEEVPTRPSGVCRDTYLDLMQVVFEAYPTERLARRQTIGGQRLGLQPFARLATVLACLIAAERLPGHTNRCLDMITACTQELAAARREHAADFAVKEVMMAMTFLNGVVPADVRRRWREALGTLDPYQTYRYAIREPADAARMHNINVYNLVGEYLRHAAGLTDATAYFARHWPVQLERFDEDGRYRDPGCPMLYDLTTRCQIQLMLGCGYDGPFATALDGHLERAGTASLLLQSAAFEFCYGGRSNQFLFNEALLAANFEYEAARHWAAGRPALAGAFKRAAHLAVGSVTRWLTASPPRHIKNLFPVGSQYGAEPYGHYDSYLAALGAFLVMAYVFAVDAIPERPCPAERGGYLAETTGSFHKVVANAGGYSVQIDTGADLAYDATGLGRLHRAGVPSELALSVPLSGGDRYHLPSDVDRTWASISAGWRTPQGAVRYLAECGSGVTAALTPRQVPPDGVGFVVRYQGASLAGCAAVTEAYHLGADGVRLDVALAEPVADEVWLRLPLLVSNGQDVTRIEAGEGWLSVRLGGYVYRVTAGGHISLGGTRYGNRNGVYRLATISAPGRILSARFRLGAA